MQFFQDILDMIYPNYCIGCESKLEGHEQILCLHCLHEMPYTNFFEAEENPVKELFYGRLKIEHAGSLLFYTKHSMMQRLLFALKYHKNKNAGKFLGVLLAKTLQNTSWIKEVDCIVPLPLHKQRLKERGYNQAEIIAQQLSQNLYIELNTTSVARAIATETQTHKSREARWQSMQKVFQIKDENKLHNKHILLIDDVLTTGATLEVCGNEILKINNTKLSIATAAYAL